MRIALTGSNGFIGSGLLRDLRPRYDITTIGRGSGCDLFADFSESETICNLNLTEQNVLIHCAGIVDSDFIANPRRAWEQATSGMEELAKRALFCGVRRLIYCSTSHVYGSFEGIVSEDTPPNPTSDYSLAHYASEQILRKYASQGLEIAILRPNAIYGLPEKCEVFDRWELVPYDLPLQAVYRQRIVLKSTGDQRRNFLALEDLTRYFENLLTLPIGKEVFVLNPIGSQTMPIFDFAEKCSDVYRSITGNDCPIVRESGGFGEHADFEFITTHTVFRPLQYVEEFLKNFINFVIRKADKGVFYGQHKK